MSLFEYFLVGALCFLVAVPFLWLGRKESVFWLFAPPSMISLFFLIYFLLGPISAIAFDTTFLLGRDMRPLFLYAWMAGVVALASIWAGYYLPIAKGIIDRLP